jgi:D-serine deaminase-like pyridoxal phosphate-dependent protein
MAQQSDYFSTLQTALQKAGLCEPVLVIDKTRLNANIKQLRKMLPRGMAYRIVAKSLPSIDVLRHITKAARTDRLMSFNANMVAQLLDAMPECDQLLGKPVPVAGLAQFLKRLPKAHKKSLEKVQWLVDTPDRLAQYSELAAAQKIKLRVNLEIDVGLHRGGLKPGAETQAALDILAADKRLSLSGMMGYEPHLSKTPKLGGWRKRAQKGAAQAYGEAIGQAAAIMGAAQAKNMVRNMAGSPTFGLYHDTQIANELAAGSALVKPSDFDLPILSDFQPAAFIATPALKVSEGVHIPALEYAHGLLGKPQKGRSVFIHGGYWMASPVHPPKLKTSSIFGRSSNQELLVAPRNTKLAADDFVFLRPHQSEAVFLQFPKIALYEPSAKGDKISALWAPLPVTA